MTLLFFFFLGALCSWPMQRLIVQLPADVLEGPGLETPPTASGAANEPAPASGAAQSQQIARIMPLAVCNGLLWAGCAWHWPELPTAVCWALFASGLLVLSIIDWQTTLLPDALTQPLLWLGLLGSAAQFIHTPLEQSVWGAALGWGGLWLVAQTYARMTGKEGMGAGDFKLLAAMGAWLGPWALLPLVFFASLSGAVVGLWLQARQQLHQGLYVPFGPFLAAAGLLLAFTGHSVFFNWLTH